MNKKTKSFIYNFLGFAIIYIPAYLLIMIYTGLTGIWIPLTAFMVTLILSPKFQVVNFHGQEKILMKWLFIKGVKEVK